MSTLSTNTITPLSLPITVSSESPCTHGHFPGNPIVPGAYLISMVAHHCERNFDLSLSDVNKVKFIRPLKPDETAMLTLDRSQTGNAQVDHVKFSIHVDNETVMSGKGILKATR